MISFETILQAVLPVYLVVVLGCVLSWRRVVTVEMERGMMKLVVHFLLPCFIVDKMLASEVLRDPSSVVWGVGVGFFGVLLGMLVANFVGRLLQFGVGEGLRSFSLAAGVQNYGYVAIPVLAALFLEKSGENVLGMLFVHGVGVELAMWGVGLMVMSGSLKGAAKNLCNGPIIAVCLGLLLIYSKGDHLLDAEQSDLLGRVVRLVMSWLGGCAVPLALVLTGATIFDLFGKERPKVKVATGAILVRAVLMPIVFLCAARWLPMPLELGQVVLVQAAMPAAVSPILMTRLYGGQPQVAMQVFLATALVGLFSMPLIVKWGLKFLSF